MYLGEIPLNGPYYNTAIAGSCVAVSNGLEVALFNLDTRDLATTITPPAGSIGNSAFGVGLHGTANALYIGDPAAAKPGSLERAGGIVYKYDIATKKLFAWSEAPVDPDLMHYGKSLKPAGSGIMVEASRPNGDSGALLGSSAVYFLPNAKGTMRRDIGRPGSATA